MTDRGPIRSNAMRANSILIVALSAVTVWTSFAETIGSHAVAGGVRPTAAQFGVLLASNQQGLTVARVGGLFATFGLRAGDQIVAVNGRRVTTERAFVGRLMAGNGGGTGANILVARNGQMLQIAAPLRAAAAQSTGASSSAPAA